MSPGPFAHKRRTRRGPFGTSGLASPAEPQRTPAVGGKRSRVGPLLGAASRGLDSSPDASRHVIE